MRRKTVDMDKVLKNSDIIQPINVEHLMEPAEDKLTAGEPIPYEDLTKEELITVLKSRDQVIEFYEEDKKESQDKHNKELEEMQKYYDQLLEHGLLIIISDSQGTQYDGGRGQGHIYIFRSVEAV